MRLLVDTHVLLWALAEPEKIPTPVQERLIAPENDVLFSAASIWEIAIKVQVGKLSLPFTPLEVAGAAVAMGFAELAITSEHAAKVYELPPIHRDPFDRLLLSQAMVAPARFLTADRLLTGYTDLVDVIG